MNCSARLGVAVVVALLGGCATTDQGEQAAVAKPVVEAPPPPAEGHLWMLAKAQNALDAGDHIEAHQKFSRVIEVDKDNPDALIGLGESLLLGGEPEKALGVFAKVEQVSDRKADALQGQGLALLAMGNVGKSQEVLESALEKNPELWRTWNALGSIKDQNGEGEEARRYYDRALEINSGGIAAINNKGMSYLLEQRYADAEAEFKEALRRAPGTAAARSNLRLALAWQGKYVEALTGASKEEMPVVLNNLGYIATKRGDYDFAEAYLSQAIELSPSYYAKAAQNLEFVKQLRNAEKTQKNTVVQKKSK